MNSTPQTTVVVAGDFNVEGDAARLLRDMLREQGVRVTTVDISTDGSAPDVDVTPSQIAKAHPHGSGAVTSEGSLAEAFSAWIASADGIAGMIATGGRDSTAVVAPALQVLPIGLPKIIVTTLASGNVEPIIGASDITVLYAVTGLTMLNSVNRAILTNAANAIAGAVAAGPPKIAAAAVNKPPIGLTMFGVTTPAIQRISGALDQEYECLVFHATGTGGRSMEKLVDSGEILGAIDLTTSEICDMMMGGVLPAVEDRLGAFIRTRVPYVGSAGGIDIVNWGAPETVPERYRDRVTYYHNPQVTATRTTPDENRRMGVWIGEKLNRMEGPVRFLLPQGGFSSVDAPGGLFWDPVADGAFIDAICDTVRQGPDRKVDVLPFHINDSAFANATVAAFREIARSLGENA